MYFCRTVDSIDKALRESIDNNRLAVAIFPFISVIGQSILIEYRPIKCGWIVNLARFDAQFLLR